MMNNMFPKETWEEYYERYQDKELLDSIKEELDNNPHFIGLSGEELQEIHNKWLGRVNVPHSWRGWGALMSAYMNSKEGKRKYCYMDFYMRFD